MLWSSPCSAHADKHCTPDSIWPTDLLPQWINHIYLFCKTLLLPPRVTARVSSSNKWRCCVKKLEVILVEDIYPVSSRRNISRRVPATPWWVHSSTSYSKEAFVIVTKTFDLGEKICWQSADFSSISTTVACTDFHWLGSSFDILQKSMTLSWHGGNRENRG